MSWHSTSRNVDEIDANTSVAITVADVPIVLVRSDARWFAIEDRCSHANCAFSEDGEIDGLIAVCNCHGSEFDVPTGAPLAMPATAPIRVFPVRLRGGELEVET